MEADELADLLDRLDEKNLDVAQYALAQQISVGWRATPATMGHHLDPPVRDNDGTITSGVELWPYVTLLGDSFRDAEQGIDPKQIWELPSQYGKSSMLSWSVLWLLDRNPRLRIMYVTYDGDKARQVGLQTRDRAEAFSDALNFRVRRDARAASDWQTDEGGGLYSVGIDGGIVGRPQDVLLLDDLIKGWRAAHSEKIRKFTWEVYRSQCRLRLQKRSAVIIAAGTRWHEDDVPARLMSGMDNEYADKWKVIRLPAIAEEPDPTNKDPLLREPDPLGRKPGEVLEPERFEHDEVQARRVLLGSYLFAAMEQQRPAPEEGGEILRAWWRWYTSRPPAFDDACTSWDTKMKDKEGGDYVAGQAWGRTGSDFWFIEALRGQYNFVTVKTAVVLMHVRHPWISRHYIENAGNGPEVIAELRRPQPGYSVSNETASLLGMTGKERGLCNRVFRRGMTGLIPNTPKGDKIARMRAQTGKIEAGNVHLPEAGPHEMGARQLVDECAGFPDPAHDDSIDSCSQALLKLSLSTSEIQKPSGKPAPSGPRPAARAVPKARSGRQAGQPIRPSRQVIVGRPRAR